MSDNITILNSQTTNWVDWYDADNWTNGVPDQDKITIVRNHAVSTDNHDVTVKELQVSGDAHVSVGQLTAEKVLVANDAHLIAYSVTVSDEFRFTGGELTMNTDVDILPSAALHIEGTDTKNLNGRIRVRGKGVLNFKGHHLTDAAIEIETTGVLEVREAAPIEGSVSNSGRLEIAAPLRLLGGTGLKNTDLGTLQIAIPNEAAAQSPRIMLEKDNSCYLDGTLILALGFEPPVGASVQVLSYTQYHCEGKFATIQSRPDPWHWQANYGDTGFSVTRVP